MWSRELIEIFKTSYIPEIDKKQALGHWKGSKTCWIKRELANLKEKELPNFRLPAQQFLWPVAGNFKVVQLADYDCRVGNNG